MEVKNSQQILLLEKDRLEACSTGDFVREDDSTINFHISIVELASCQSLIVETLHGIWDNCR